MNDGSRSACGSQVDRPVIAPSAVTRMMASHWLISSTTTRRRIITGEKAEIPSPPVDRSRPQPKVGHAHGDDADQRRVAQDIAQVELGEEVSVAREKNANTNRASSVNREARAARKGLPEGRAGPRRLVPARDRPGHRRRARMRPASDRCLIRGRRNPAAIAQHQEAIGDREHVAHVVADHAGAGRLVARAQIQDPCESSRTPSAAVGSS